MPKAPMNKEALLVDKLGRHKMLVVGDLMLDSYIWTNADRISPEAPVMILRAEREEARLGGAASVASMLRALEAEVSLAGVTGDDAASRVVRKLLTDERISHSSVDVDGARPTTTPSLSICTMGQSGERCRRRTPAVC